MKNYSSENFASELNRPNFFDPKFLYSMYSGCHNLRQKRGFALWSSWLTLTCRYSLKIQVYSVGNGVESHVSFSILLYHQRKHVWYHFWWQDLRLWLHDPALPGGDRIWRQQVYLRIIFDCGYIGVMKLSLAPKFLAEVDGSSTEAAVEECFQSRTRCALKPVLPWRDIPIIWKKNISVRRDTTLSKARSHQ